VTSVIAPAGTAAVTFNGMGRVGRQRRRHARDHAIDFDNPSIANGADRRKPAHPGPDRGAVRLCDPLVTRTDPRTCS